MDLTLHLLPKGLQALHLLSHTEGEGGLSSLVDGFGSAQALYKKDQQAYKALSRFRVYAHASGNEGISIQPAEASPVLTHATDRGGLTQVRWNTADRAGVHVTIGPNMESWYDAAA